MDARDSVRGLIFSKVGKIFLCSNRWVYPDINALAERIASDKMRRLLRSFSSSNKPGRGPSIPAAEAVETLAVASLRRGDHM